jgi:hypothetical protein
MRINMRINMRTWGKAIVFVLFLTLVPLITPMANAQTTSSHSNNTNINPVAFTLTIYSPDNNQTCKNTMLLNFTIDWTTYPTFTFPIPPAPILHAIYTYTIDNNSAVFLTRNQSSSDIFGYSNFTVNPTFSYLLNVSNLKNGYHKIVITADLTDNNGMQYFNASSDPVFFSVQNPTPSPAISSVSPLTVEAIVTVAVLVAAIVSLLLYRRHQKTTNLKLKDA